jgi:acetylornithine deacetylase/succinyl-diaminopimelate desuccinylase-like protein
MTVDTVLDRIDADLDAAIGRAIDLLRIPSISTDPAHAEDCDRAADWLVADLTTIGFAARKVVTPGRPMVVAHGDGPDGQDGPHLLYYGHYDVQPVDPLNLWTSPPFEPAVEDTPKGKVLRGRGSADDKGKMMTFVEACRAWKAVHGTLPCRITLFFEGEEESGSPSLVPFLKAHADELRADIGLICDTDMYGDSTPAIVTQLRGLLGEEVTITGPSRDLHSGMYGGLAMNPARVLARVLAGLHDETGRVTLRGFYDGVPKLPQELRAQWERLDFDAGAFLADVGLADPAGEDGRMPLEMVWSQPTCEINGLWSGYTGAGFKTVLPSRASAKISFRLVGTQDPHAIRKAFRAYVRALLPDDCSVSFADHGASAASVMAIDHPAFEQARTALTEEWATEAAYVGSGGSIPVAGHFKDILGMDTMLIGFGRADDAMHSPNEKFDIECLHKGARSWARILDHVSRGAP